MAVLIFKALEKCNSNCLYCDTITKGQQAVMGYELLELVFQRIGEFLEKNPHEDMAFTWHGGEVCLLGADYLEQAYEFQERHCAKVKHRIMHSIQSNLTLLNPEMLAVFKRFGLNSFGTSFEPIPNIRGFGPARDSDAYNRLFFRAVEMLEKEGISWGVIYTAHRKSLERAEEVFHYLVNMNLGNPPRFNFVRCFNDFDADFAITDEEYADFLGRLFRIYWKHPERYRGVQPFTWYVDTIVNGTGGLVCDMQGGCSHRWLFIGPEGEAAHCGVAGDYSIFQYGNIRERSIEEILNDANRDEIARRQEFLAREHCSDCRFWGVCHGGCPVGAFKTHDVLQAPAPTCGSTRLFLERYLEPITGYRAALRPCDCRG